MTLATGFYWLLIPLAYGFWARVLTGPKLSPLAWLAMNVVAPRLGPEACRSQAHRSGSPRGWAR